MKIEIPLTCVKVIVILKTTIIKLYIQVKYLKSAFLLRLPKRICDVELFIFFIKKKGCLHMSSSCLVELNKRIVATCTNER